MILIDAEALLYWLDNEKKQEQNRPDADAFDHHITHCKLATIAKIKSYVKEMPTFEPKEKAIATIESPFDEKTFSKIIKDLLAEHEATQKHEHDYFLAGVSSVIHSNHYKRATLVCKKCAATKEIEIKG